MFGDSFVATIIWITIILLGIFAITLYAFNAGTKTRNVVKQAPKKVVAKKKNASKKSSK